MILRNSYLENKTLFKLMTNYYPNNLYKTNLFVLTNHTKKP